MNIARSFVQLLLEALLTLRRRRHCCVQQLLVLSRLRLCFVQLMPEVLLTLRRLRLFCVQLLHEVLLTLLQSDNLAKKRVIEIVRRRSVTQ